MSRYTQESVCKNCGVTFIYRCNGTEQPLYCAPCYHAMQQERRKRMEAHRQRREDEEWRRQNAIDRQRFEEKLLEKTVVPLQNISPDGKTLYIIGNGFDLMHGVKSSYRAFRDSMGKNNSLREKLEWYLNSEDIWADFEEALGHIRMDSMANPYMLGEMLELTGFFDDDAGAAEYYMAQDIAVLPMQEITADLNKYFRRWVDTLEAGTKDRPLASLIHDDKVLCFNYTEFIEELYGVSEKNVCYIHGCRRKRKGKPVEKLILGHRPGASDQEFDQIESLKKVDSFRTQAIDLAQENVIHMLAEYDESLTKDCQSIICRHQQFFEDLADMENIVVIGHSMSRVDWDYFAEVGEKAKEAKWYFGCHGIHDLENTEALCELLGIDPLIFRTDDIPVTTIEKPGLVGTGQTGKKRYKMQNSPDGKWSVRWYGRKICIKGKDCQISRIMQAEVRKCVFSPYGDILFVILKGWDTGIAVFRLADNIWTYLDELIPAQHQTLINNRLRHIYLDDRRLTFVYNNRIREYSLETGELVRNQGKRNARTGYYPGTEITGRLTGC